MKLVSIHLCSLSLAFLTSSQRGLLQYPGGVGRQVTPTREREGNCSIESVGFVSVGAWHLISPSLSWNAIMSPAVTVFFFFLSPSHNQRLPGAQFNRLLSQNIKTRNLTEKRKKKKSSWMAFLEILQTFSSATTTIQPSVLSYSATN